MGKLVYWWDVIFLNFEAWFGLSGVRNKHVEDGEPFSRRVFDFGRFFTLVGHGWSFTAG